MDMNGNIMRLFALSLCMAMYKSTLVAMLYILEYHPDVSITMLTFRLPAELTSMAGFIKFIVHR